MGSAPTATGMCGRAHISTTEPSTCGRIRMGRGFGGKRRSMSSTSVRPMPGASGIGRKPPTWSDNPVAMSLPSSAELPSSSGVRDGYSWMAKFGMQAATGARWPHQQGVAAALRALRGASTCSAISARPVPMLVPPVVAAPSSPSGGRPSAPGLRALPPPCPALPPAARRRPCPPRRRGPDHRPASARPDRQ